MSEDELYDKAQDASCKVEDMGRDLSLEDYIEYIEMVIEDLQDRRVNAKADLADT